MTASKLEEAQGNREMPEKIIPRGIKSLQAAGVHVDRDWWLKVREGVGVGGRTYVQQQQQTCQGNFGASGA